MFIFADISFRFMRCQVISKGDTCPLTIDNIRKTLITIERGGGTSFLFVNVERYSINMIITFHLIIDNNVINR